MRYILIFLTAVWILLLNTAHGTFRDNFILVGDSGNLTTGLYQINIGTGETVQLLPKIPRSVVAVAYDPRDQEFFYSDIARHAIVRYSVKNGREELLHQTFDRDSRIEGMVLDHVNRQLYFADSPVAQIFGLPVPLPGIVGVIDLETNAKTILCHCDIRPRALQLDLENMNLYFIDRDEDDPGIFVIQLNSNKATAKRIVSTNLYWPNGLAIDSKGRKMYFADVRPAPHPCRVEVANLDGSGRQTILEEHGVHYYALALDSNFIYLTGWNRKQIRRIDRFTNRISNVESTQSFGKLFGISVYVAANEPQFSPRVISGSTTAIKQRRRQDKKTAAATITTQSMSTSAEPITSSSSSIKVLYQTEGNVSPAIAKSESQNLQNVLQQFINNPVILVSIAVVVVAVIISATVCCAVRRKRSNNSPMNHEHSINNSKSVTINCCYERPVPAELYNL